MDNKLRLLMQLIKNGDLGGNGGSAESLSAAGTFLFDFLDNESIYIRDFKKWPDIPENYDDWNTFLSSLNQKQVYCVVVVNPNGSDSLNLLSTCYYENDSNPKLFLDTSFGTILLDLTNISKDGYDYTLTVEWGEFLTQIISVNEQLAGNEPLLESVSFCGQKYEVPTKATKINYLTEAPTEANYDGLIFVVLAGEPQQRYDGYIYIITEPVE